MKKAQIWISAVLYIALGIILITLILTAGMPLIDKMKDRNTISHTKSLLFSIDNNIKQVAREGPGSKRYLTMAIEEGELIIKDNKITWNKETSFKLIEPNTQFEEGSLNLELKTTETEEEYKINLELDYNTIANINLESQYNNPFKGRYGLSIEHNGTYFEDKPNITISIN